MRDVRTGWATPLDLDRLERFFAGRGQNAAATRTVLADARARAEALLAAAGERGATIPLVEVGFAAEALAGLWLERRWSRQAIDELVRRTARLVGVSEGSARVAIYVRALTEHHLLALPPRLAVETQLGMMLAFAPVAEVSLWTRSGDGRPSCVLHLGEGKPTRGMRSTAEEVLRVGHVTRERGFLHGVPVDRWGRPHGALVIRARPEARSVALTYAHETAVALAPLLETDALLERNAVHERSLVGAAERRLTRLGVDLHDGPMQSLALLGAELWLFRRQLEQALDGSDDKVRLVGRIGDLEARLHEVAEELRKVANALESPGALPVPFVDAARAQLESFRAGSSIDVRYEIGGTFGALTASQRIALLGIVQEALQNARNHSDATGVFVRIHGGRSRITVELRDNGRGFELEQTVLRAARAGRLGLIGMSERARLLGGRLDIDTRPGGPTVVRATLPRWRPVAPQG